MAEEDEGSPASARGMSHLKPPGKLDFDAPNLAITWKRWRQEIELYMELALTDRSDDTKVKLFLYVIGEKGREIYDTLDLDGEHRTLTQVINAFENYCNPKKNETVERYKFFVRAQEENEPFDQFVTDLRVLATSCNFGQLKNSLLRDRIICGTKDSKLRQDLLKVPELDLEQCLRMCRAAELSKVRTKTLEASETLHTVSVGRGDKQKQGAVVQKIQCKYCGLTHERDKRKCPALGKKCVSCHKLNHFASQCKSAKKVVYTVEAEGRDDEYDEIKVVSNTRVTKSSTGQGHQFPKKLYATINVGKEPVKFQLDTGATCNVISKVTLERCLGPVMLDQPSRVLTMYNQSTIKPLGQCTLQLHNYKNGKSYETEFVVLEREAMPLLGSETIQEMDLVKVQLENILSIEIKDHMYRKPLTKEMLLLEYPDVFEGTGKFEDPYHLEIDENAVPVVHPPRKVPVALKAELKEELERLQALEIIAPVSEPTPWVSSMVIARKSNGRLRICLDPKDLNRVLRRSHYPMPTIEEVLPELSKAKVFSTFDVRNGFWHVPLDDGSSLLTTFNTPFGRFRWLRLPFGLSSAPEEFQRRQHQIVEGLPGILSIHDDILLFGEGETLEQAQKDHDDNLHRLMQRCRDRNVKLNPDKVCLCRKEVPFIGHVLTDCGVKPDPAKVQAVLEMPRPTDVAAVQRFIGFVNYLSKFLPRLSEVCEPLRQLTLKEIAWHWDDAQEQAFESVKKLVTEVPVLRYYDPTEELTLQCDSSEKGLGAVITQRGQPVAFASRALSDVETRYSQIEKELLAVVFGLERFHQYTYARPVTVQSDHKPLEVIARKPLLTAPKRLQRMLLRVQAYDVDIVYRKGTKMQLADTLSRAYLPKSNQTATDQEFESINMAQDMPISAARLDDITAHSESDESFRVLTRVIRQGWPETRNEVPPEARPYFNVRDELSVQDSLIFRGERVLVPKLLRKDMVERIHSSHIGAEGCLRRARECLYWPGMSAEIKDRVSSCDICRSCDNRQSKETLCPHEVPDRPWAKVAVDLFEFNSRNYLVTVDYFSGFWEVDPLESTKAVYVIRKLKMHFARYGIPDVCHSDNGPQFQSAEYQRFSKEWKFKFTTSSPTYPRSNGKVENAVQSAKRLMKKAKKAGSDVYLALLDYRNTPTQGLDTSPAQRLLSRRTKTLLPTTNRLLEAEVVQDQHRKLMANKARQATYYNRGSKDLPELSRGDVVRVRLNHKQRNEDLPRAEVQSRVATRSYEVLTEDGRRFRRNRIDLRKTPERYNPDEARQGEAPEQPLEMTNQPSESCERATAVQPTSGDDPQCPHQVAPASFTTGNAEAPEPSTEAAEVPPPQTRSGRIVNRPSYLKDYV